MRLMTTAREETVRLAELLQREHHALAEFLVALAAFDRERRWVELGHSSLFYFLTRELGLSAGAAYYRKTAAELIQRFPEVVEPLRDGRLCFTSVVELSKNLTPENRETVLPRFFHVSKREAKAITAELRPVVDPPMRNVVTTLPAPPTDLGPPLASGLPLAELAFHPDEVTAATPPVPIPPASAPRRRVEVESLTADLCRIHLTTPRELLDNLADARDALSHSHPGASDDAIIIFALKSIVERHRKRRGIGTNPRKAAPAPDTSEGGADAPPPPAARSRHVPAHVWREVWERDGGCCAWPLENGGVCGSTHKLQLDHVEGWALGADTTTERCRILCAFHNDLNARQLYGDELMNGYTRPKGPRCSEPVVVYGTSAARGSAPRRRGGALSAAAPRCPRPRRTRTGRRSAPTRRRCRTSPRSPRSAC
jgi:hypothetical protein